MPTSSKSKVSRRRRPSQEPTGSEDDNPKLLGVIYLILGILGLCAIISYTPNDLTFNQNHSPEWKLLFGQKAHNLIGPFGVAIGWLTFWFFGKASFFIPIAILTAGFFRVFKNTRITLPYILWGSLLLISICSLLEVTNLFGVTMRNTFHLHGPGGGLGFLVGHLLFEKLFATVGSIIILVSIAAISAIYIIGTNPVIVLKGLGQLLTEWFKRISKKQPIAPQRHSETSSSTTLSSQTPLSSLTDSTEDTPEKSAKPKKTSRKHSSKTVNIEAEPISDSSTEVFLKPNEQAQQDREQNISPKIVDSNSKASTTLKREGKAFEKPEPTLSAYADLNYELPGFDLLDYDENAPQQEANNEELYETQETIIQTLRSFNVDVSPGDITRGPTITRYEIKPATGLRVNKITQLEADLARATRAERINILAPIPGKDTVGIEVANEGRVAVPFGEILQSKAFASKKKKIPLVLGKNVYGEAVIGDLAACPHMLVAGATGAGKSVCINALIASMLYKFSPDELRFIMVDPKVVEMQMYSKLPHLVVPVVTDPKKVVGALAWVVNEMERRYRWFAEVGVRNFDGFNARPTKEERAAKAAEEAEKEKAAQTEAKNTTSTENIETSHTSDIPKTPESESTDELQNSAIHSIPAVEEEPTLTEEDLDRIANALSDGDITPADEPESADQIPLDPDFQDTLNFDQHEEGDAIPDRIPYIVVIVDELADLMQTAPADVESLIARIAQKARAAGIHLIIATQTPRADVVTGMIKANIPTRIAFQVSSKIDSRVILDNSGAEKLIGKGDLLFMPPGSSKMERSQGAFVLNKISKYPYKKR